MANWLWDAKIFDYVDGDGNVMGRNELTTRSRKMVTSATDALGDIGASVGSGSRTVSAARLALREELKNEYIRQYMMGRGGRPFMTSADWGSIGGSLAEQFKYLERNVIPYLETMSEAQIRNRMSMYANSSREAFFRGQSRARGFEPSQLPYMPADGDTICLTKCNCEWDFSEVRDEGELVGFDAYWRLGGSVQHCDSCLGRAAESSPFQIRY